MGLERTWRARRRDTRLSLCVYSSYADISLLKECQLQAALQASRITIELVAQKMTVAQSCRDASRRIWESPLAPTKGLPEAYLI